jgi:hypothetical protein
VSHIVGAAAVTGLGVGWRGLGQALVRGERIAAAVPPLPAGQDVRDLRAARLMSRSARLAAVALHHALGEAGWSEARADIGYYLGVGASAGDMTEILPLLRASIADGALSLSRLGREGLAVSPPLLSFTLLNNFTLCHGAIAEGVGGPNAALFSRGGGTVVALAEALHVLEDGECERVVVGGADCAVHPVTRSELRRTSGLRPELAPAEAAGILALSAAPTGALAVVEGCALLGVHERPLTAVAAEALSSLSPSAPVDAAILVCGLEQERGAIAAIVSEYLAAAPTTAPALVLDAPRCFGEALAAGPALAWLAGLDLLVSGACRRVLVVSHGADGDLGVVRLARPKGQS